MMPCKRRSHGIHEYIQLEVLCRDQKGAETGKISARLRLEVNTSSIRWSVMAVNNRLPYENCAQYGAASGKGVGKSRGVFISRMGQLRTSCPLEANLHASTSKACSRLWFVTWYVDRI